MGSKTNYEKFARKGDSEILKTIFILIAKAIWALEHDSK